MAEALRDAAAIVLAPSNPLISIALILAVPHIRELLERARRRAWRSVRSWPGWALRGPAAEMLELLGHEASPVGVARIYRGLIDVLVLDREDAELAAAVEALGIRPLVADTVSADAGIRAQLARVTLDAAGIGA